MNTQPPVSTSVLRQPWFVCKTKDEIVKYTEALARLQQHIEFSHRQKEPLVNLFLLGSSPPRPLRLLDTLLIRFDLSTLQSGQQASALLPRPLEVSRRGLAEQVDLDQVSLEGALEGNDGLDDERVGVLEVHVHHAHHPDAHQLRLVQRSQLLQVVRVHRRRDRLGLLTGAHGCRLDVLEDGHVW